MSEYSMLDSATHLPAILLAHNERGQPCKAGETAAATGCIPHDADTAEVLGTLPRTKGHLAAAARMLGIARDSAMVKLQKLAATVLLADVIPVASDFARINSAKGTPADALGVPVHDLCNIASRALAWAWKRVKEKLVDNEQSDKADAVVEVYNILREMVGTDMPPLSREEVEGVKS